MIDLFSSPLFTMCAYSFGRDIYVSYPHRASARCFTLFVSASEHLTCGICKELNPPQVAIEVSSRSLAVFDHDQSRPEFTLCTRLDDVYSESELCVRIFTEYLRPDIRQADVQLRAFLSQARCASCQPKFFPPALYRTLRSIMFILKIFGYVAVRMQYCVAYPNPDRVFTNLIRPYSLTLDSCLFKILFHSLTYYAISPAIFTI